MRVRRQALRGGWVLGALVLETIAFAIASSDTTRGAIVGAWLIVAAIAMTLSCVRGRRLRIPRSMVRALLPTAAVLFLGVVGVTLAIARGNNPYYMTADVYHWFAELVLMGVLTAWASHAATGPELARAIGLAGVLLGGLALAIILAGMLHLPVQGGHLIPSSGLFRLDLSRGFPELPMIAVTGALLAGRSRWVTGTRSLLLVGYVLLLVALVFTFKRTMWITYGGALFLLLAPRTVIAAATALGGGLLLAGGLVARLFPQLVATGLGWVASHLQYSAYTVEDTLAARLLQYAGVVRYLQRNPMGYGFGAEFTTFVPTAQGTAVTHYIHNFFLYYALQLGIPGLLILVSSLLVVGYWCWKAIRPRDEWEWAVRAGVASVAVLLVNGMTLVSTHTVFAGAVLGFAATAVGRAMRQPVFADAGGG